MDFIVRGAHQVAPDLVAGLGPIGAVGLTPAARADAEIGFAVRAALGPLDAGQAVAVVNGRVVAIEGAEGTDAMLQRIAGQQHGQVREPARRAYQGAEARPGAPHRHAGHRPAYG